MKLVSIPANPVPDNAVAGTIKTPDGVNLRFARWAPPPGRKGTVVLLQGRAEFIEKYFETVRDLRARGFAVATFDWRGQGAVRPRACPTAAKATCAISPNTPSTSRPSWTQVVLPDCPPPIFCARPFHGRRRRHPLLPRRRRWFERVVLSAPMIALPAAAG